MRASRAPSGSLVQSAGFGGPAGKALHAGSRPGSPCNREVSSVVATDVSSDVLADTSASSWIRCHRQRGIPLSSAIVSSWPCVLRRGGFGGGIWPRSSGWPHQEKHV